MQILPMQLWRYKSDSPGFLDDERALEWWRVFWTSLFLEGL